MVLPAFRHNGMSLCKRRLQQMSRPAALLSAILLTGCATLETAPTTSASPQVRKQIVCWPKPFEYNSTKKDSARHAGPALANDLKQHNFQGTKLGCWK